MYVIILIKTGQGKDFKKNIENEYNTFKDRFSELKILETLGRADYAITFKADNIDVVFDFAMKVRNITGVSDAETLIGIEL